MFEENLGYLSRIGSTPTRSTFVWVDWKSSTSHPHSPHSLDSGFADPHSHSEPGTCCFCVVRDDHSLFLTALCPCIRKRTWSWLAKCWTNLERNRGNRYSELLPTRSQNTHLLSSTQFLKRMEWMWISRRRVRFYGFKPNFTSTGGNTASVTSCSRGRTWFRSSCRVWISDRNDAISTLL